jgi:hypothetical protein
MQKDLTIVAVTTANYELTNRAIEKTLEVTKADKILVLSDKDLYPGSTWVKIDPITQIEYSRVVLKDLAPHITTDHYMVIQYDGMPIDADKWDDSYLDYDYIGAPWSWGPEDRRVGNGGFSIRSRRLAELCQDPRVVFNPPGYGDNNYMEDIHICKMYRDWLESEGLVWAPVPLAAKFSAEFPGGRFPTYGFHGTLCLPYYLDDEHLEFYINHLTPGMLGKEFHIRIFYGLFMAQRYDHLEQFIDRAMSVNPNFKDVLINQMVNDAQFFPTLKVEDIEQLLINY